jgi:hypothetical protein
MGCDQCTCGDLMPTTFLHPVERVCVNCGTEITYRDSFSSGDVRGELRFWHLVCTA